MKITYSYSRMKKKQQFSTKMPLKQQMLAPLSEAEKQEENHSQLAEEKRGDPP